MKMQINDIVYIAGKMEKCACIMWSVLVCAEHRHTGGREMQFNLGNEQVNNALLG